MDDAEDAAVKWGKTWQVARLLMFIVSINEKYYSDDVAIIPKLARFHIEFEGIHPFIGGNGRTG